MSAPNILLVTDDQHRWDFFEGGSVSCLSVPALSRLAAEGTTLTHAYSNCPICMPTRFTWLYGLYASQAAERLAGNAHDWPGHLPSMTHALRDAGYRTALVGKLHSHAGLYRRDLVRDEDDTRARGFDDVFETSGKSLAWWFDCRYTRHLDSKGLLGTYRDDVAGRCAQLGGQERYAPSPLAVEDHMDSVIGAEACRWLEAYDGEKPFFLHASFCGPHFPLDPPEPYFGRHRSEEMPAPDGVDDPGEIRKWQERRALYCDLIVLVDEWIGRLLGVLDAKGLAGETLVVFTTDHGDMMGHCGHGQKGRPHDASARTPVIARLPGVIAGGKTLEGMIEAVDLPCAILEAAGGGGDQRIRELLPDTPGRSWWKYVCGDADSRRDWIYCEHHAPTWRMAREHDWKYVCRPGAGDMLFNMADDLGERDNLIDEPAHAERVSRMRRQLITSMATCTAANTDGRAALGKM